MRRVVALGLVGALAVAAGGLRAQRSAGVGAAASAARQFRALLAPAGLLLRPAHPDEGWLGVTGLDTQDRIVSVAGRPVTSESALSSIVAGHRAGEQVTSGRVCR